MVDDLTPKELEDEDDDDEEFEDDEDDDCEELNTDVNEVPNSESEKVSKLNVT